MLGGVPEPRVLAGKYRLAERIAQGGMGSVWRAEHLQLHMPVAVKLMSPKMLGSEAFRVRFEREALAVAQLRSRHVVTVHDYGFDGHEPFIVMELLEGEDLAARLRRERRLVPEAAALVVGQVARALERAHAAGLVHRDLKPGNVFLAHIDDEEVVKVLDFGIAKAFGDGASDDVTGDDEVLGTPHYMSPEQIRKTAIDPRADLWALAVIAYRMLTGVVPFSGPTRGDVVVRACSEPHAPPSSHDPALGPPVDRFFERALAKLPQDRFESARALAAALDAALGTGDAAQISWQRASMFDLAPVSFPPASFSPASLPAVSPMPAAGVPPAPMPAPEAPERLSLQPANVQPPSYEPARRRGKGLLSLLAIAVLSAGVAVPVGLGVLGDQGDAPPDLAAAAGSSPPSAPSASAATPSVAPASAAAAEAPPPVPSTTTGPQAAPGAPSASTSAAPAAPVKPSPNKRRKVVIGL